MKIFMSHSIHDKNLAEDLARRLADGGFEVWRAAEQVLPGENFALKIGRALEESDAMIVLVSPDSMRSEQVRGEISYALASPRYAGRVVPIVIRQTDEMPWILRRFETLRAGRSRAELSKRVVNRLRHARGLAG